MSEQEDPGNGQSEKTTRWQNLWHRLNAVRFDPLPSEAEVESVMAALPKRQPDEDLPEWLKRAGNETDGHQAGKDADEDITQMPTM
jgi:hypothetical protein